MSRNRSSNIDRRKFLQLMGLTALASSTMTSTIARALEIPANNATGSINDVEHIVILMQENTPFDRLFGTLWGVRGFSDPRAVNINLPLQGGGTTPASVFLQPATATPPVPPGPNGNPPYFSFSVAPDTVMVNAVPGPSNGVPVVPPYRAIPAKAPGAPSNLGGTYLVGTEHDWNTTHAAWNNGLYDSWAAQKGVTAMSYQTRDDAAFHYALADAFTVCDGYFSSLLGPTIPNRFYHWTGCIGNVGGLGTGGTDGQGNGPVTFDGLYNWEQKNNTGYYVWETFPEVLLKAGVTWKIYQDIAGSLQFDDGDGLGDGTNPFTGTYTDNPTLYFQQYQNLASTQPLYENATTGTDLSTTMPSPSASQQDWQAWAEGLFSVFQSDVQNGTLPQVSWIVAPAGYSEHWNYPRTYGAWFINQVLNILVSNAAVFSNTVLLINYDEGDGGFDHLVPPSVPQPSSTQNYGKSTVSIENEIVPSNAPGAAAYPPAPIGLGLRVPLIVVSPWTKGGYVNSQVFDHTSVIQFIEKRFGVKENNISPWRRGVAGDLTSVFNFANPNDSTPVVPSTGANLPSTTELDGKTPDAYYPTAAGDVTLGVPAQETNQNTPNNNTPRLARTLPYEVDVQASVDTATQQVTLTFLNNFEGSRKAAAFQVRSGNPISVVRQYILEAGKTLSDTWDGTPYNLWVYGPNGFVRYFNGSIGSNAAALEVTSTYYPGGRGSIGLAVKNVGSGTAKVSVRHGYTGELKSHTLKPQKKVFRRVSLKKSWGWYDLTLTVAEDSTFRYRLGGHVETGGTNYSDPTLVGLFTLPL